MPNATRYKNVNIPRQSGELARLKVIQGADAGAVYVVTSSVFSIGRGEDSDVMISDLKASRIHARVNQAPTGWAFKDQGSSNGILHNGKMVREGLLRSGDVLTVGETMLEWRTSEVGTMMLVAPPRSAQQIIEEQKYLENHQGKMAAMGLGATPTAAAPQQPVNKKTLIYGVVGLGVAFLLFSGDNQPARPPPKKSDTPREDARDLAAYLPATNAEVSKAAEMLFKEGLREYLNGNFNRARTQFETVLQIAPGHVLATIYSENCEIAVKSEVKVHLENGKKAFTSGKLRDAKAHYERIIRLLFKDQSNPAYLEAVDQLEKVKKKMAGGEAG